MYGHMGQPTNYSLMNEVYETNVLFQYRVKVGRLSSTDSFVSNAGAMCDTLYRKVGTEKGNLCAIEIGDSPISTGKR